MSLYDDAKFIFSGQAAAGAPKKAFALKPVEKLKAERVTNGAFPNNNADDDWTALNGPTFSDQSAVFLNDSDTDVNKVIYQTGVLEAGKTYKIVVDVEIKFGNLKIGTNYSSNSIASSITTTGRHSFEYTAADPLNSNEDAIRIGRNAQERYDFKVHSISVKEIEQDSKDFVVTRDSNLGATRVKGDGYIEKGRENLLKHANNLHGNGWANTTGTPTNYNAAVGGQTGYDGSKTAWLIDKKTVTNSYVAGPYFGYDGVFTWSMYAKNEGGTDNGLHMYTPYANAYFDLVNGTIDSEGGSNKIEAKMVPVTGSAGDTDRWYRCSVTGVGEIVNNDSEDRPRFKVINIDGSDGGDGNYSSTGKIFVQYIQFEAGLVATPFIETGSITATAGLQANEPRYDYLTATNDCPGALIEPTRENLLEHSEYLGGEFGVIRSTFNYNDSKSPEGRDNAVSVKETTVNNTHGLQYLDFSVTDGTFYSFSFFVKADGREKFYVQFSDDTVLKMNVLVDLSGTPSAVDGRAGHTGTEEIIDYGNGWYRVEINGKEGLADDSDANLNFFFVEDASGTNTSYAGDTTKGLLFYGMQIEEGPWCSSYIPTYGSTVTREYDHYTTGQQLQGLPTDEFTVFIDYKDFKSFGTTHAGLFRFVYRSNVYRSVFQYNTSIGYQGFNVNTPGTPSYVYASNAASEGDNKIAVVYNKDNVAVYVNGSQSTVNYNPDTTQEGIQRIELNYGRSKMTVNSVMVFDRALTKDEAVSLTT